MKEQWERPAFRDVRVNGECTSYSGQVPATEADPSSRAAAVKSAAARGGAKAQAPSVAAEGCTDRLG